MPQMFPLLWFYLFLACAMALFMINTLVFFAGKINPSSFPFKISSKEHNWKW